MPSQSRPLRAARKSNGSHIATKTHHGRPQPAALAPTTRHSHHHNHHPHQPHLSDTSSSPEFDAYAPPAKRRKFSIRSKQTTLDHHFPRTVDQLPVKPPTKVTVTQPHGRLRETINGVQTELDASAEEFRNVVPAARSPASGKVPQPLQKGQKLKQEEKRTLRSQDEGPRLKSELSIYFANYEETIFDVPKEQEFITLDTAFYIIDDSTKIKAEEAEKARSPKSSKQAGGRGQHGSINDKQPPNTPQRSSSNQFNGSPSLNLDLISRTLPAQPDDPLTDDFYLKSHRRAERREKQLRNIERERAMHEKVQLDRILDGLRGHDWLKVLGITGITDGEAKKFEPKRDYFIEEVRALVDKFKLWKEQEKRQKTGKGSNALVAEREELDAHKSTEIEDTDELEWSEDESMEPSSNDLNASAAQQLQQETALALASAAHFDSKPSKHTSTSTSQPSTPKHPPPSLPLPPPEVPIESFYVKRHLRDAALGKARHGRNVTAFGHPIPDLVERDFRLPRDLRTEEVLTRNARERRRRKRASVVDGLG